MATPAQIIPVPKPGRGAFNPDRALRSNALVMAQVNHFAEADSQLPPELQTGIDPASVRTEGQAAAYVRKVTEAIHQGGGRKVQRAG